jgi:hypothetical protein
VRGRLSGIPLFHLRERECAIRVGTLAPCQERLFYKRERERARFSDAGARRKTGPAICRGSTL